MRPRIVSKPRRYATSEGHSALSASHSAGVHQVVDVRHRDFKNQECRGHREHTVAERFNSLQFLV